eukprot:g12995.t1
MPENKEHQTTVTFSERPPSTCSSIPFAEKPTPRSEQASNKPPSGGPGAGVQPVRPIINLTSGGPPTSSQHHVDSARSGGSSQQVAGSARSVNSQGSAQRPPSQQLQADNGTAADSVAASPAGVVAAPDQTSHDGEGAPDGATAAAPQGAAVMGNEEMYQVYKQQQEAPVYHEAKYVAYKNRVKNLGGCHLRPPFAKDFDDERAQDLPPPWMVQYPDRPQLPPIGGPGEIPLPTAANSLTKTEAYLENRSIAHHCQMRDRYGSRIFG